MSGQLQASDLRAPARVLIVDDDDVEQLLAPHRARQARSWSITLDFAMNAREICALTAAHHYDLVICDNRMPGFADYREVVAAVRQAGHAGPIVVASASIYDAIFREHQAHGVLKVVDKLDLDGAQYDALLNAARNRSGAERSVG